MGLSAASGGVSSKAEALDLNNDKTKMSRVEAIDAMIKHLQEYRSLISEPGKHNAR
jgi:hypothetical protein